MAALSQRNSVVTTALAGVGMLCCVYLAALKLIDLPCPLSGCGAVINSSYGSLLGVPLPVYALPLWVLLSLPGSGPRASATRLAGVLALALGGIALMGIQFFVLRGFCPFCTLHAVAAVAAAFTVPLRGRAHPWLPAVILALVLPVFVATRASSEAELNSPSGAGFGGAEAPAAAPAPAARAALPASIDLAAFQWLGPIDARQSPVLVVSLQCGHCLELLNRSLHSPQFGTAGGPKLFIYAQPQEAQDSIDVIAAILSAPGTPTQQFSAVFSHIDELGDPLLTHNTKQLRRRLEALFPGYASKLVEARQKFNLQMVALKFVPGKGSPYLLMPDGTSRYGVIPANLLFH
ncbi:MAG TPA: vitamin K epoxide reductase family protein [Opitutaceae bacterium]